MEQCEELLTEQLEPLLHDNQHDRIAAGLAMGVALLFTDTQARGESLLRDLLASGTAAMCARRLGYASANSFAASVCHWFKDGRQHVKYICQRELIPRSEVDSLPRKPKRPARVRSTDEPKG